jgi:hypothetical protein
MVLILAKFIPLRTVPNLLRKFVYDSKRSGENPQKSEVKRTVIDRLFSSVWM